MPSMPCGLKVNVKKALITVRMAEDLTDDATLKVNYSIADPISGEPLCSVASAELNKDTSEVTIVAQETGTALQLGYSESGAARIHLSFTRSDGLDSARVEATLKIILNDTKFYETSAQESDTNTPIYWTVMN